MCTYVSVSRFGKIANAKGNHVQQRPCIIGEKNKRVQIRAINWRFPRIPNRVRSQTARRICDFLRDRVCLSLSDTRFITPRRIIPVVSVALQPPVLYAINPSPIWQAIRFEVRNYAIECEIYTRDERICYMDRVTNGQTASDSRSDRIKAQMGKSMLLRLKLRRVLETRKPPDRNKRNLAPTPNLRQTSVSNTSKKKDKDRGSRPLSAWKVRIGVGGR